MVHENACKNERNYIVDIKTPRQIISTVLLNANVLDVSLAN